MLLQLGKRFTQKWDMRWYEITGRSNSKLQTSVGQYSSSTNRQVLAEEAKETNPTWITWTSTLIINPGYWLVTLTIFFGRAARSTPLLDGWILKPEPLDAWLNSQRNLVQAESQGSDFLLNWVPHKAFESYVKDSEIKDSARKCLVAKRTRGFPMRPGAVVEAVKSTVLTFQFMALTYMAP